MTKKEIVLTYWQKHKKLSIKEIAANLDIHYATVRHALKDKLGKVAEPKKTGGKSRTVSDVSDPELESLRNEEFIVYCPKCGKQTKARVVSVEMHNTSYKANAGSTCHKCKTSFTIHNWRSNGSCKR